MSMDEAACGLLYDQETWERFEPEVSIAIEAQMSLASIAISLKRIADILEGRQ